MSKLSRRDLLKGLGLTAVAGAAASFPRFLAPTAAQISNTVSPAGSSYAFMLGDWNMYVIQDVNFSFNPTIFGVNQDEADVLALFNRTGLIGENGQIPGLVDILVADTGDDLVLFDTGFGNDNPAANLRAGLEVYGYAPEDVTAVIMTHFHPDHISGLSSDGTPLYPNAQVFFPQVEKDFLDNAPENVSGAALGKLQPVIDAEMVTYYNDGDELLSGFTAMATPGHTPGHSAIRLENGGNQLVDIADAVLNVYAHVPNPGWHSQFDGDGVQAAETRRNLLDMLATDQIPLFGYHFPFPGIYSIAEDGDGFEAFPVSF